MKKITLIIPCYNEQEALPFFYEEVTKILSGLSNYSYELLFINDGSDDDTLSVIKSFAAQNEAVKYLSFSRNFGKESAMYAGFCHATGDLVAIMDADMQDPPSLLPEMLEILEKEEYDCVATRRFSRKGEPPVRSFFAKQFYRLMNRISRTDIQPGARDFRLMKRPMVDAIVSMCEYNRFSKGIFGWIGFRTYWLPYENVERVAGKTKWSFFGLFRYALDGIFNFSQAPLYIASWFGLFMTMLSVVLLLFVIIRKLLFGDPVAGWASQVCIMIFIGGIQLFCMGIMGQYIAKIYLETKHRPPYIIAETNLTETKKATE